MCRSWTKLITKSGPKFNAVLERFKEISLAQTADQYTGLRQKVIDAKLNLFKLQRDSSLLNHPLSSEYSYFQYSEAGSNDFGPQY
jgi:hypothetical protein